ncbi:hypothetical protein D3C76_1845600 [compost metagenome]
MKVLTAAEHVPGPIKASLLAAEEGYLANRFFHQFQVLARAGVDQSMVAHVVDE